MKILRIITRMNLGGPSRQISLLHQHLGLSDSDHILVIGSVSDFEFETDLSFAHNVHRIRSLKRGINPFHDVTAILALIRIIKAEKPDIIHSHLSKAWLLALIANKVSRNRSVLIHTFHGHTLDGYFHGISSKLIVKIQMIASIATDFLIAVGEKICTDLISSGIGKPQKFEIIYPGVFTEKDLGFKDKDRHKMNLLYVGRLEPIKQPEALLQVCRQLELLSCSYELNIVGEGSMCEELRSTAEKERLSVNFHGWQQEIDKYFKEADLLLLCSISEGAPIVIIEAATYALPTLTTSVGSVNEMITNDVSGFILPSTDMFAAKINQLSKNKSQLISTGLKANLEMSEKFGLHQFISAHQNLYSLAIQTRSRKELR